MPENREMGEGRLERAIRETLAAHPDETFLADELAERCYPDASRIERKRIVWPCCGRSPRS